MKKKTKKSKTMTMTEVEVLKFELGHAKIEAARLKIGMVEVEIKTYLESSGLKERRIVAQKELGKAKRGQATLNDQVKKRLKIKQGSSFGYNPDTFEVILN